MLVFIDLPGLAAEVWRTAWQEGSSTDRGDGDGSQTTSSGTWHGWVGGGEMCSRLINEAKLCATSMVQNKHTVS